MIKTKWESYRRTMDVIAGDRVKVVYHWNFGRPRQRIKELVDWLDLINDRGIVLSSGKRISYKSLESLKRVN